MFSIFESVGIDLRRLLRGLTKGITQSIRDMIPEGGGSISTHLINIEVRLGEIETSMKEAIVRLDASVQMQKSLGLLSSVIDSLGMELSENISDTSADTQQRNSERLSEVRDLLNELKSTIALGIQEAKVGTNDVTESVVDLSAITGQSYEVIQASLRVFKDVGLDISKEVKRITRLDTALLQNNETLQNYSNLLTKLSKEIAEFVDPSIKFSQQRTKAMFDLLDEQSRMRKEILASKEINEDVKNALTKNSVLTVDYETYLSDQLKQRNIDFERNKKLFIDYSDVISQAYKENVQDLLGRSAFGGFYDFAKEATSNFQFLRKQTDRAERERRRTERAKVAGAFGEIEQPREQVKEVPTPSVRTRAAKSVRVTIKPVTEEERAAIYEKGAEVFKDAREAGKTYDEAIAAANQFIESSLSAARKTERVSGDQEVKESLESIRGLNEETLNVLIADGMVRERDIEARKREQQQTERAIKDINEANREQFADEMGDLASKFEGKEKDTGVFGVGSLKQKLMSWIQPMLASGLFLGGLKILGVALVSRFAYVQLKNLFKEAKGLFDDIKNLKEAEEMAKKQLEFQKEKAIKEPKQLISSLEKVVETQGVEAAKFQVEQSTKALEIGVEGREKVLEDLKSQLAKSKKRMESPLGYIPGVAIAEGIRQASLTKKIKAEEAGIADKRAIAQAYQDALEQATMNVKEMRDSIVDRSLDEVGRVGDTMTENLKRAADEIKIKEEATQLQKVTSMSRNAAEEYARANREQMAVFMDAIKRGGEATSSGGRQNPLEVKVMKPTTNIDDITIPVEGF